MIPAALWPAVQAALDRRRDPLEEQAVSTWLAEHPEDLEPLLELRWRLAELAQAPPARLGRARWVAAAAGILLTLGLPWISGRPAAPGPDPDRSSGRILHFRMTVADDLSGRMTVVRQEDGSRTVQALAEGSAPDRGLMAFTTSYDRTTIEKR